MATLIGFFESVEEAMSVCRPIAKSHGKPVIIEKRWDRDPRFLPVSASITDEETGMSACEPPNHWYTVVTLSPPKAK
jgi:hypothetical protein